MNDVFTDPARRAIVSALLEESACSVDELVAQLATHPDVSETEPGAAWIVHEHILPMAHADLVTFDADDHTVSLAPGVTFSLPTASNEDRSFCG